MCESDKEEKVIMSSDQPPTTPKEGHVHQSDQLICKTPQESPSTSIKSFEKRAANAAQSCSSALYLGIGQLIFGFLMAAFGVLAVFYDASLAQVGGGIWGGCLAMSTGITGVLAGAKNWCPLKTAPQKIVHTSFLALSLISLAISQLVVALASTGLGRDINNSEIGDEKETITLMPNTSSSISITLPANYQSLFANVGLVVVSLLECVMAAVASYKSARIVCPCFRRSADNYDDLSSNRQALVRSWLGRHSPPFQPLYIVADNSSKGSSMTVILSPPPPPPPPPPVGYTLIPAPLGTIPSPIIPPSPPPCRPTYTEFMNRHRRHMVPKHQKRMQKAQIRKSKSKETLTEEEVVKSYTGLDKAIAEEFIDICDSRNNSLCSDSSHCCQTQSISEASLSQEYLVKKI